MGAGFLDHPVEDEVVLVAHSVEEVFKQLAQIANVRLFFEFQAAAVVQVDSELVGQIFGQRLNTGRQLLITDFFVLFFLGARWQALPGQAALVEVHEDEAEGL